MEHFNISLCEINISMIEKFFAQYSYFKVAKKFITVNILWQYCKFNGKT